MAADGVVGDGPEKAPLLSSFGSMQEDVRSLNAYISITTRHRPDCDG